MAAFAANRITIHFPWLTVQRHLKGKHNQKEHGRRAGAEQLTLFDRDEYISQEWVEKNAIEKYKKFGLTVDGLDSKFADVETLKGMLDEAGISWDSQFPIGYSPEMGLADFIEKTFEYSDPETGLKSGVTELNIEGGTIQIKGKITNEDGVVVGNFERNIEDGIVDHTYFALSPSAQGRGLGSKFYKHLEESYYDAGLTEVTIHANIDVGGYAWAKMGYDFQDDDDRFNAQMYLEEAFYNRYANDPDYEHLTFEDFIYEWGEPPYHAWEFAAFTGPDGARIGKKAMLGSSWMAYKALEEGDPTWEVGQDYYESKGL